MGRKYGQQGYQEKDGKDSLLNAAHLAFAGLSGCQIGSCLKELILKQSESFLDFLFSSRLAGSCTPHMAQRTTL